MYSECVCFSILLFLFSGLFFLYFSYFKCLVTAGVSINLLSHGMVSGFCTALLPQLKSSNYISIDEESASWIASIYAISQIMGTLMVPAIMNNYGRRIVSIISATLMTSGWILITSASSIHYLLIGRFIQGLSMGFTGFVGPVLVGEYTSPKYRGMLLTTLSVCLTLGILTSHAFSSFLQWKLIAIINASISFLDLLISLYSPESPSFLVTKGRYDECRKVFHWLRGYEDEEELEKLIRTDMNQKTKVESDTYEGIVSWIWKKSGHCILTFRKKEVYKSVIVMSHLYGINIWSGGIVFDVYANDVIDRIAGNKISYGLIVISLGVQRLISNILGISLVKKMKRRLVLILSVALNISCFLCTALYVYLKTNNLITFDHPLIGIILMHVHIFTLATGGITLPTIIAGEIFPLKHRSFCGMICMLFFCITVTINLKTAPNLFSTIGLHGSYVIYACLVGYFLSVALFMLPETKDRTLQEIEEEFQGAPVSVEYLKTEVISLNNMKEDKMDESYEDVTK